MDAIIYIDVQKGFIRGSCEDTYARILKLNKIGLNKVSIATKFINTVGSNFEKTLNYTKMRTIEEQKVMVECDYVFEKSSYSLTDTLICKLKKLGVGTVYVCGFDTEACILSSMYKLFDEGFNVKVIHDCCMSSGGFELHLNALSIIKRSFGEGSLVSSKDLVK